jgi:methylated-DNA-protein-cysteine methyltransferase-like protein
MGVNAQDCKYRPEPTMDTKDAPLDWRIWQVVAAIPRGQVASYGDVASRAGLPGGARRVGAALRKLPPDTRIPWHRVINARGRISLPAGSAPGREQRKRLADEGIIFGNNCAVDMVKYRWRP